MKKLIILVAVLNLLSCKDKKPLPGKPYQNDTANPGAPRPDSLISPPYTWEVLPGSGNNKLVINKIPVVAHTSLKLEDVLQRLNKKYEPLKIAVVKTSGDTLFVNVRPGKILTQEMGSTGADIFMTEATLNLCEVPAIHYVHYQFPPGDHAMPGTYSRKDFLDLYTPN